MNQKNEDVVLKEPLASIPFQTLIYFDELFSILYFLVEFGVFIYKGFALDYPPVTIGIEIFLIFAFVFIQFSRLFIGTIANSTETPSHIGWFIQICFPTALMYAFFLRMQTFVIVLEVIVNSIGILFLCLEFLISIFALRTFKNYEKTQ